MYKAIIVDDEEMIRTGIRSIIPWSDIEIDEVLTAASGKEAMEMIQKEMPQIMLTDICMVEMNGLALIEQAKKVNPKMKILVLTGYDDFNYAQQCCKLNVQDFILKPADEEELLLSIKNQIRELNLERNTAHKQQLMSRVQGVAEQIELESSLRDLLDGEVQGSALQKFCDRYSLKAEQMLQIAIMVPITEGESTWEGQHDFLQLSVKNICMEMFDSGLEGITFEDKAGRIVIAVFCGSEFDEVVERIGKLKDLLKNELDVRENIVLGGVVRGFAELASSYADALRLLGTLQKRKGDILQPEESEQRLRTIYRIFNEQKKIMTENIADVDILVDAFEKLQCAMNLYNLSNSMARRLYFDIASALYFIYINDTGNSTDNKLNALLDAILIADREEAFQFSKSFVVKLFGQEENNTHELITTAKRYIKENLENELTVSNIAEMLFLNPNYFSRLFKKVMGEGCNEYIVRKRMEKAKSLLESTQERTGRIARMVGYHDTNYFSLAFKKNTGMSPTEYREKIHYTKLEEA